MDPKDCKVFYFCHSHNNPRGGQKHTYQHVDILNKNGYRAAAFHPGPDFRLTWFENRTRVINEAAFLTQLDPHNDYVVLPEDLGRRCVEIPGRRVIFNKNIFTGFSTFDLAADTPDPYTLPDTVAALTVSQHNLEHLQLTYPQLAIHKVEVGIDFRVFQSRPLASKLPIVACSVKAPEMLLPLYKMISSRAKTVNKHGTLFQWIFLTDHTEDQVAAILRDAVLFISCSVVEGIGRTTLEAMAAGCIVIAFDSGPLQHQVATPWKLEYGNLVPAVHMVEEVMRDFPGNIMKWGPIITRNSKTAAHYSSANQEDTVLQAWNSILQG
jgi:hypothetical protein